MAHTRYMKSSFLLSHIGRCKVTYVFCFRKRHGTKGDIVDWVLQSEELASHLRHYPDCSQSRSLIRSCICDCKPESIHLFWIWFFYALATDVFCSFRHQRGGDGGMCLSSLLWFWTSLEGFQCRWSYFLWWLSYSNTTMFIGVVFIVIIIVIIPNSATVLI